MTIKPAKALRMGLLLSTGALFITLVGAPATAGFAQNQDTSALLSRLNALENQVQTLSRSVYRGGPAPAPLAMPDSGGGSMAGYEDRLSELEQRQRELTGKVEQMTYELQQMKERLGQGGGGAAADSYVRNSGGDAYPSSMTREERTASYGGNSASDYIYGRRNEGGEAAGGEKPLGQYRVASGSPDALYEEAFTDIREARYDAASAKFQQFMSKYPNHALAANAQYWLAETYYVRADYKQAAKMFAQGYQDYPKGSKAPANLLKLGLSLSRLGKKDDACLTFQQLKKEFPGGQTPEIRAAADEMKQLGCG
jgi:tol-pal system protein YbgF